ncbi:GFA family protein [Sneathiella sp.]|jgi:hypothetical protein|uniref:GFA family protein n=1 Tax=Sneathiella sp. TaxID=1964365 RepID=UPI0039E676B1
MDKETTGSCLCGKVKFHISGAFDHFYLCHCTRCRKDTGSVHAANLFTSNGSVLWVSGSEYRRQYTLPGSFHTKSFCSLCGSSLPTENKEAGLLMVPAGCLDTPVLKKPDAHIMMAHKAGWEDGLGDIPLLDELPEQD